MSSTGDESVLPIDFNGSLDPGQLPNVTLGNHSIMQAQASDTGHSPKPGMSPNGRLSPGKGRTMKEYDQQISLLKKENFSLKMRIFYMEDRMQQQYGGSQDVFKTNIELQVQVDTLKKDLAEKQIVLQRASEAMEMFTSNQQQDEESIRQKYESEYLGLLENLKSEVDKREKECEKSRQEAQALRGRVGELEAELKSTNQARKDVTQQFESAKFDIQSLTGQLKLSQQSVKDLELEKNGVVDRAKKMEKQMAELKQQLARKDRDIQNLSAALEQPCSTDSPPSLDVIHLQDKCQDQREEIDDHLKTIADLEQSLKTKDHDIQNLEDELNTTDKALKGANQELEKRGKEMNDKGSLLDRYKKSTESVFRKLMDKEKLCKSMNDKLQKWKEQYAELEKAHKELKSEKDQVRRQSLMQLAEMNRDRQMPLMELQETKLQLENVIQCLGRREGELSRFQEQLKTAMEALTQSEHAVEELQAQLKAERAEYDSKLRQQALQLSLSASEDTDDEMASLKRKVKDLQNLIADQNVVNLALGREKAELEKSLAHLNKRDENIEDLKKEHEAQVHKLEREIQALKLDLSGKDIMLESIQKHPIVVETSHRETVTHIQTDFPKRPSVLDIETIWLDLLEDMKKTLNMLRNEIQSHPAVSGQLQSLVTDNATADLLLTEIKSIQKVYHQLEKGVEKNSQLHEALLYSLTSRGTRQSSADSPDGSSCQDGGPSTVPTRDGERDDVDSILLRHLPNPSSASTCPFPSQPEQTDRSSQTLSRFDAEELVNRYLQTSKSVSPERCIDRSAQTSFNTPLKQHIDRSLQVGIPSGQRVDQSAPSSAPALSRSLQSSSQSVTNPKELQSKTGSGISPLSNSELHLSHLVEKGSPHKNSDTSLTENKIQSADNQSYHQLSHSSTSLLECTLPCEVVTEGRGRRVTFELGSNVGLTDDAKEGHLKKNHCSGRTLLDSFVEEAEANPDDSSASLMEVTLVEPNGVTSEEEERQSRQLDRSGASNEHNVSDHRRSLNESTHTLRNQSLEFGKERNDDDERGSRDGPSNCWDNESYRVTEDQGPEGTPGGRARSILSPGQQQQLQRQHQQVIATMSAQELRDLIAHLQQDLIDSVKQNHALKEQVLSLKKSSSVNEDQIKQVQDKLHATENTVRYQSIRIKSYKAALDKVGAIGGSHHSLPPLSDRSTMSVERARCSQPFSGSLPLAFQDNGTMLEGSLTDIQSKDGSPSQSLANISPLSARNRQSSSSMPSGLCFVGTASQIGLDGSSSPGRRVTNHSNSHKGDSQKGSSPNSRLSYDQGDTKGSPVLPSAVDESSLLDPTYTSLIDTTLFSKHLSSLDRTTSHGNTTLSGDQLQARITQLEQMNAALKEEIRLVNDLCTSMGIALDLGSENNSRGPHRNVRDELLRKHLIEIRQLRQRLERLDLGNDPDQHLIFQTHIHQRIHHQESLIIQLQKQMEEKEEKFHREVTETQHRLLREKSLEVEKVEKVAKKETEALTSQLKAQEELIQQLQEKCSFLEQRESEINRLKDEKQETEQDLVKRELEILDMEKSLFSLELAKEGLEVKVRQLETDGEEKEKEIKTLQDQVRDHKESCRVMRDTLLKREESLRDKEFTVQKMTQERSKMEQRIKKQESELNSLSQREEELTAELKATREKKRELELRLVDAEDNLKRKQEAFVQANRQMGSLMDKAQSAESSLRSCQEDLRSCQEDLRSCQEDLRSSQDNLRFSQENLQSCQENLRVCQDNLKAKEQKLLKREKQLQHLISQYKKLDVAFTKLQYKVDEKTVTINSLKRVNSLYEAASKQDTSEDLMQSLLQELMMTKRQVADLLSRLQAKSNTQPSAAYGKTMTSCSDSTLKTTTVSTDEKISNDDVEGKTSEAAVGGVESSSSVSPGDIDQALDQLSASMYERLDGDGNLDELLQSDNRASCDPVLKEQNENLRKELTRLQCKYDLLDHKVKEQGSRLQASSVRQKDWEKSLCRQLIKTTRELEQAKENIDCTKKIFQASEACPSDSDQSQSQHE